jgi:hypothetical protein
VSKGSNRRPEDRAKIAANWPFPEPKKPWEKKDEGQTSKDVTTDSKHPDDEPGNTGTVP